MAGSVLGKLEVTGSSDTRETRSHHRSDAFWQRNRQGAASQHLEESWSEMTREYLVVYEKGASNWSAFSPDLPGCGSLGDAVEDTRANLREAMELYLRVTAEAGGQIPDPTATSVNFDEFDPGHEAKQYVVEWLAVSLPQAATQAV